MDESGGDETVALIYGAAQSVHKEMGSGLSESIYKNALAVALRSLSLLAETEVVIPVSYQCVHAGFMRPDIVVNKRVVLELKCVAKITDAHFTQLRAYLRWYPALGNNITGVVINFGATDVEVKTATGINIVSQTKKRHHRDGSECTKSDIADECCGADRSTMKRQRVQGDTPQVECGDK